MEFLEKLLKNVGIPAIISAVIAALVTVIPFLFKIDERYAKDDEVKEQTVRTQKALTDLNAEIAKLAGTQEVIVTIVAARERKRDRVEELDRPLVTRSAPAPIPVEPSPSSAVAPAPTAPAPKAIEKLEGVSKDLKLQQSRVNNYKF